MILPTNFTRTHEDIFVLDKLKLAQVDSIEYGVEQITDKFMICGCGGGGYWDTGSRGPYGLSYHERLRRLSCWDEPSGSIHV